MRRPSPIALFLVLCCALGLAAGCSRDASRWQSVVVENRHDGLIGGYLMFGDLQTHAGGGVYPKEISEEPFIDMPIPERASIDMDVYPPGKTGASKDWTEHRVEIPVRSQVPRGTKYATFWFIIEQDLSIRLVVLSHEEHNRLMDAGERPK